MKKFDQGYRLLFVDDDRIFGKMFVKWFGYKTNYEVSHLPDAHTALAFLEHHKVDMVVTNVRMPGMGGIELTKVITERFKTKVVVFAAGSFPGEREQAFASGAAARLFKPMKLEDLANVIVQILDKDLTYIGNQGGNQQFRENG